VESATHRLVTSMSTVVQTTTPYVGFTVNHKKKCSYRSYFRRRRVV